MESDDVRAKLVEVFMHRDSEEELLGLTGVGVDVRLVRKGVGDLPPELRTAPKNARAQDCHVSNKFVRLAQVKLLRKIMNG